MQGIEQKGRTGDRVIVGVRPVAVPVGGVAGLRIRAGARFDSSPGAIVRFSAEVLSARSVLPRVAVGHFIPKPAVAAGDRVLTVPFTGSPA